MVECNFKFNKGGCAFKRYFAIQFEGNFSQYVCDEDKCIFQQQIELLKEIIMYHTYRKLREDKEK